MAEEVRKHREEMVEAIAETDEDLMVRYLEGEEIDRDELKRGAARGDHRRQAGARALRLGAQEQGRPAMLDAVDRIPAVAAGRSAVKGRARSGLVKSCPVARFGHGEPFAALAFKIVADPYVGRLAYFRVYSGMLKTGSYV